MPSPWPARSGLVSGVGPMPRPNAPPQRNTPSARAGAAGETRTLGPRRLRGRCAAGAPAAIPVVFEEMPGRSEAEAASRGREMQNANVLINTCERDAESSKNTFRDRCERLSRDAHGLFGEMDLRSVEPHAAPIVGHPDNPAALVVGNRDMAPKEVPERIIASLETVDPSIELVLLPEWVAIRECGAAERVAAARHGENVGGLRSRRWRCVAIGRVVLQRRPAPCCVAVWESWI